MTVKIHRILNMTEQEIEHTISVHVRAYAMKDPAIKMMVGGDWSLAAELGRAMIRATLLEGEVYAVKDERDEIVSFGLWAKPGVMIFSTSVIREDQRALGFNAFFEKLDERTKYWWKHTYPETFERHAVPMFTKEEVSRRWWCANLVTDPDYQGRGYGTAIVDHAFKRALEADGFIGLSAVSPVTLRRYLAMGLRKRGDFLVSSPFKGNQDLKAHILTKE
ncbi:hypothetical protein VNI00_015596 [Paramarasmius palmivorus]|uniref:N-acetyltransferase domain-containing protein n=1 Tax=Paramarasmius palmivorus TaxID=297713 RepID=A0AAW0BJ23_9AGAR